MTRGRCVTWLLLLLAAAPWVDAAALVPPAGFYREATVKPGDDDACPSPPPPYTGDLMIPSKYEGSGPARDQLNKASFARYKAQSKAINELEKGVSKQVAAYLRLGRDGHVRCTLNWLESWARADALLSTQFTHTGKSMRKWALGSLSAAYLRLKFSRSQPLRGHEAQVQMVEAWIGKLGEQVLRDWQDQPQDRLNNHQYWAAWAAMAASVVVDRRELFDWAVSQYRIAASQVDDQGYLPRELSRETRALAYHNYSLGPLMMLAVFAQANGVDLREDNHGAMRRLAARVEEGIAAPQTFERKTGFKQELEDLRENSKFAWLEPYCALYTCSAKTDAWRRSLQPLTTYRLGGDLTQLFAEGRAR